jgi:Ni,Fe-hydrogenase III large subunit
VLRDIYDEHAGLQDRFRTCGIVTPALAAQLGLTGMAGRASGQARDLRCDFPVAPYDSLAVRKATSLLGDVAGRVAVRFDEALESLRLIQNIAKAVPGGEIRTPLPEMPDFKMAAMSKASGAVLVAPTSRWPDPPLPSAHIAIAWPVLEHAVIGNIVPDFPLINKSINLTYSGHDL